MVKPASSKLDYYRKQWVKLSLKPETLKLAESPVTSFFQIAGFPDSFEKATMRFANSLGLPQAECFRISSTLGTSTVFAIAPETWLCSSDEVHLFQRAQNEKPEGTLYLADLSHAWSRFTISGKESSTLLMRGVFIDLSDSAFPENGFVKSSIHGMPVLIHRLSTQHPNDSQYSQRCFNIYAQSTYVASFCEWLTIHASKFC